MLDQYFRTNDKKNELPCIQGSNTDNEENEDDCWVNEKYFMKDSNTKEQMIFNDIQNKKTGNAQDRLTSIHQLDTLKNSNQEENENSIDNNIQLENAYLRDGRCTSSPKDDRKPTVSNMINNEEAANEEIEDDDDDEEEKERDGEDIEEGEENEDNRNNPTKSNEGDFLMNNENRLKQIQEKMHSKIRKEYESKFIQKENQSQNEERNQLSNELTQYKDKSQLENKKKQKENKLKSEKYDQMVADCKEKLRNDKEAKYTRAMQDRLRPQIQNEIYKNEYDAIVSKIREEIESEISKEIEEKKKEEIVYIKRKMDYLAKVKAEEIEKRVKQKSNEEMEKEMQREISIKESEYKLKYMQKYELFKSTLEKKFNKEFEDKKKEVKKEIDEIKSKLYRSKCSEKLKINKINKIKKNINDYQKKNMKNSQQVEQIINAKDIDEEINNYSNQYKEEMESSQIQQYNSNNNNDNKDNNNNNNDYDDQYLKEDDKINAHQNNSVNLFEINNKLKQNMNKGMIENKQRGLIGLHNQRMIKQSQELNVNNSQNNKQKIIQKTTSPSQFTNSQTNANLMPTISLSQNSLPISPEKRKEISSFNHYIGEIDSPSKIVTKASINNKQLNNPIIHQRFNSLQLDPSIPTTFQEFGKFLICHIEKEENYRLLFQSEKKKIKNQIKKVFDTEKRNDHCLTDYMLEIWNKLEISYAIRYSILKGVAKMTASEAYSFLDTETEHLTDYFQESEEIFRKIKSRESLKVKLQTKLNRNELMAEDQIYLDQLTSNLHDLIKKFKSNHHPKDIIWKGLLYEWFMNYEKWFYEIKMNN